MTEKWQYVVRFEKDGRMKDRYHNSLEEARVFHDKNKKYNVPSILMRCRPRYWYEDRWAKVVGVGLATLAIAYFIFLLSTAR